MATTQAELIHEFVVLVQHKPRPHLWRHVGDPGAQLVRGGVRLSHVATLEPEREQRLEDGVLTRVIAFGCNDDEGRHGPS
jgi:hypothetical protein